MSSPALPRCRVIAEFTSNHLGDDRIVTAMLTEAKRVGVDVVKFQSWQASQLRKDFTDYEATFARHKSAELSDEQHRRIIAQCRELGLEFLTTCFDQNRVDFLASLGVPAIKVASPDATSWALLEKIAAKFQTLFISTGLISNSELDELLRRLDPKQVVIFHCISSTRPRWSRSIWLAWSSSASVGSAWASATTPKGRRRRCWPSRAGRSSSRSTSP